MPKTKPGLPSGFALDVEEDAPVQLGDYLEETAPGREQGRAPSRVVELPAREQAPPEPAPPRATSAAEPAPVARPARDKPINTQVNMTLDTKNKLEALIARVRDYSAEKNPKGSDIMCALVEAAHDAISQLEFSAVPKRGQWGKPTARAYRDRLSAAFAKGIATDHIEKQRAAE